MKNHESNPKQTVTVLGSVPIDRLGVTLPHEHLLIDMKIWFSEPREAGLKRLAYEPITIENLGWIIHNQYSCLDNIQLLDESLAIEEARRFKNEGGGTIVDVTTASLGRDPLALARIARATGLNIIMGTGFYEGASKDAGFERKSVSDLAEELIAEIRNGVGETGIRAGIIGEIGCSWPLTKEQREILHACAQAQQETGAAITIHPGRHEKSPEEILKVLQEGGADPSHIIMGHLDRTGFKLETILEMAQTGCYLQFDTFGPVPFYPLRFGVFNRPCDRERIEQIGELINRGYLNRLLISQDTCLKTKLCRYGGSGYAHIMRNIVPQMLARGITRQHLHTIMVENPGRLLGVSLNR